MVKKRAKLTLGQPEVVPEAQKPTPESRSKVESSNPKETLAVEKQPKKNANLGAAILFAGLTIASLVIFRQKIF